MLGVLRHACKHPLKKAENPTHTVKNWDFSLNFPRKNELKSANRILFYFINKLTIKYYFVIIQVKLERIH